MDEIFKEEFRDKSKNEIKYNKEIPELVTAPQKEEVRIPNPEQDKKQFQERQLDRVLKKKSGPRMNKKLYAKVLNPDIFVPERKQEKPKAYQKEKNENLKKVSAIQNELSRFNIEKDRQSKKSGNPNEKTAAEMQKLDMSAQKKTAYMLSLNRDPLEVGYIEACVDLDKVMKAYEICNETMKDGEEKNEKLRQLQGLMKVTGQRVKDTVRLVEKEKAKREKVLKRKQEAKQQNTIKPETRKVEKKQETIKPETRKVDKKSTQKENINPNLIRNRNIIRDPKNGEIIPYSKYNGKKLQEFFFVKRKPENLKEALELRSQVTRNFDVGKPECPIVPLELYYYYQDFVEEFSKMQTIEIPPEYLEKIDVSSYNLETVAMLRNRITNGGLLYRDLKGEAKEAYDYYDAVVKRLIRNDGTILDHVVQHEARQMPAHQVKVQTNLGKEYEKQVPASNDCWSCAGSALLNHYLREDENYKKVTQEDFRAYRPVLKSKEEMGLDDESYDTQKNDILTFTTKNQSKRRERSPMGNPYMLADFYLEKLEQAGKKNVAVRKMVFQAGLATRQKNGMRNKDGKEIGKDTNALLNLRAKFCDVVKEALHGDSVLTLLYGVHYLTIVEIDKDELIVHNSGGDPKVTERRRISDVLRDSENQRAVELVWFQKIEKPEDVTGKFRNISYNAETKQFGQTVRNYSESIAQNKGVGAWKNLDEKDADIADLVMDGIYLPKHFAQ